MVTCLEVIELTHGWMVASGSQANLDGDNYQVVLWRVDGNELKQ